MSRQATNWLPPFTLFPALDVHPSGHWNPGKWQSPMLVFWGMHLCYISPMMPCYFIRLIKKTECEVMGASQAQLRRVKRSLASFSLKPYHGCLLVLHGMGKLLPLDLPFRLTSTRYCFLRQILGCWRRKFTSSRNRTNM
jgi:hypothetical protein